METQASQLKQIIRKAREEGDFDTETEAQERLTTLMMEQRQVASYLQQAPAQQAQQPQQAAQQTYQQPQQPARQQPKVSPKAEEWAGKNPWFGQDRVMTYAAWGIHQTMVEQEGVDPESEEYYTELDRRLRSEFPQRFKTENRQQRSAPAVAPASRASGVSSARKTVRLSPSQVAIAKKLGVPLEEYAKYVKD
jgi:predicted lipid-binding transport protein (Tim44 family)